MPGNALKGGGQHRGKLRAFAQVKGHHTRERRGAKFADEPDEVERPRIPVPQLLLKRYAAAQLATQEHQGVGQQSVVCLQNYRVHNNDPAYSSHLGLPKDEVIPGGEQWACNYARTSLSNGFF